MGGLPGERTGQIAPAAMGGFPYSAAPRGTNVNYLFREAKKIKSDAEAHTKWNAAMHHAPVFLQDHKYIYSYLMQRLKGDLHMENDEGHFLFVREVNNITHPQSAEMVYFRRHEFMNPAILNLFLYNSHYRGDGYSVGKFMREWRPLGVCDTRNFERLDTNGEAKLNVFYKGFDKMYDYWGGELFNHSTIGFILKKKDITTLDYDRFVVSKDGNAFLEIDKVTVQRPGPPGAPPANHMVLQLEPWSSSKYISPERVMPGDRPDPDELRYVDNDGTVKYGEFISLGVTSTRHSGAGNSHAYWAGDVPASIYVYRNFGMSDIRRWLEYPLFRVLDVVINPQIFT